MSICQLCRNLFKDENSRRRLCLEFTPDSLQNSVLVEECQSCLILLDGITLMLDNTWSFAADVSRVYGYGLATQTDTLTLELYFHDDRPRLMLEIFHDEHDDPGALPWKAIRPRASISGHPLSQKAMHWVKSRFEACAASHSNCTLPMDRPLPTRILGLDRISEGNIGVKLIEVENKTTLGTYAALSHCWGQDLPCVLSKENREQRLGRIPWTELPQTFQDAIRYCLELGVSYLWIDALCIIQDDPEDWQSQSAMMATIYENSYITLAATASQCGSSGLFQKQPIAHRQRILDIPGLRGQDYRILIRQSIPHWAHHQTPLSKVNHPLLSRGWVFQERILSPRVLHFCKQELVWECGQEIICECGSKPSAQNLKLQFALAARLQDVGQFVGTERDEIRDRSQIGTSQCVDFNILQDKEATSKAIEQWHGIVEQYSALELTKESDCLPALSGLAERMSPFLGDYLAGLWRRSFVSDLCWRVNELNFACSRPAKYRGPSWSWVSTKERVAFWKKEETTSAPLLDIMSCAMDVSGKNNYGEVSSSLLLVEGNLNESKLTPENVIMLRSLVYHSFEVDVEWEEEVESNGPEVAY